MASFLSRPAALEKYTFILAVLPLPPDALSLLVQHTSQANTAAFYLHSVGFYAHFTAQVPPAYPIVDTHPDPTSTSDLRLLEPWPELLSLARTATYKTDEMPDDDHGHIPYVLLLLHYLDTWRADHEGVPPSTYGEKVAFRDRVRAGMRASSAAGDEENYEEAIGAVLKTISPHAPSSAVRDVFTAPEAKDLTPDTSDFWIIAHAVNEFWVKNGVLPLSGSLPDMKAKSHDYVTLQNTYRMKARKDVATVNSHVRKLEEQLGRKHHIPDDEVASFCKSAGSVKLVRGKPPQLAEPTTWGERAANIANHLSNPDSLLALYIAFLAYDAYSATHDVQQNTAVTRRDTSDSPDVGAEKMAGIAQTYVDALLKEAGEHMDEPEYSEVKSATSNCASEIARASGVELHNISAVMGGIAAQEAIKVITEQYVPVDNVCIYDGISSKVSALRI